MALFIQQIVNNRLPAVVRTLLTTCHSNFAREG
jgi:hypothetical protein